MDVNTKLNNYIENRTKQITLSQNTLKKYKKNSIDILLSKSDLTDTDIKNHKKIINEKKNILNNNSKSNSITDTNFKNLNNNNKLLSNSNSITHTIVKAKIKEKEENEKKIRKLQEIVSSTGLNVKEQLSDFELCSQLNKLSASTDKSIKSNTSRVSNISKKIHKKKKKLNKNFFNIKLYLNGNKIDKQKMEILYKRLKKRKDKIKDKLIDKNIIKEGDNIPFKILFQLYINDLKNDLELKIC